MRTKIDLVLAKIKRAVGSTWFLVASLTVFVLQALWIVLSSNLLPYDEYYHLGIIRFYAQQWSPIITWQPDTMSLYGDVTRLPSYMYHYLMSFPYRFLDIFFQTETPIIILLRLINVAFIVAGIILFWRLFIRAGVPRVLANVAVLGFVMTPIVIILGAQNNYDNLMFMLTPVFLGLAYSALTKQLSLRTLLALITVGMFTSMVKLSFLVIMGPVCLYVLLRLIMTHKKQLLPKLVAGIGFRRKGFVVVAVLFVLVGGLFVERFGVNAVRYRQLDVNCAKVQPIEVCDQYTVWHRNAVALSHYDGTYTLDGVVPFSRYWFTRLMRGNFAIFANIIPDNLNIANPYGDYRFRALLPVQITAGYWLLLAGVVASAFSLKRQFKESELVRISAVALVFLVASLWLFNYTFYVKYARAYAIQSRYILPLFLPMFVMLGTSLIHVTHSKLMRPTRGLLTVLVILYCIWGGIAGWIIRSDPTWYWRSQTVIRANNVAKSVLNRITPH